MIVVKVYNVPEAEDASEAYDAVNEAEDEGYLYQTLCIEDDDPDAFLAYLEYYRRTFSG